MGEFKSVRGLDSSMIKGLKFLFVFICLLSIASPLILLWTIEISMIPNPDVTYLMNGNIMRDALSVYHMWIYVTMGTSFLVSAVVLFNLHKF